MKITWEDIEDVLWTPVIYIAFRADLVLVAGVVLLCLVAAAYVAGRLHG